jgi:hypothetical protein
MRKFVLPTAIGSTMGAGLGIATNLIPVYWPAAPHWFLGAMLWIGLTALVVPLPSLLIWYIFEKSQARHIFGVVSLLIFWIFCYIFFSAVDRRVSPIWGQPPQPDVTMCLANVAFPALAIKNPTEQVAPNIRYSFGLFDLDSADPGSPLPLKSFTFDFVPAKGVGGPMDIFTGVTGLKNGDRIVGSIGLACPTCVTGRTYWISILWGQSGWFSPVHGESSGGVMLAYFSPPPNPMRALSPDAIASLVSQVPAEERIPIKPSPLDCMRK